MASSQPFITAQGLLADGSKFFHVALPVIEEGVSRVLAVTGNSAYLHELDALGHIVTTVLNVPLFREITAVLDALDKASANQPTIQMPAVQG